MNYLGIGNPLPSIRACPFCGGPGEVQRYNIPAAQAFGFSVECQGKDCGASIGVRENTARNAIVQWNYRRRRRAS